MTFARPSLLPVLAAAAACLALASPVRATVLYSGDMVIGTGDPTQSGRLNRKGISQDWSGSEAYPGFINFGTPYHYTTLDLDLSALAAGYGYGAYVQVSFDSESPLTFLAAYRDSDSETNWLGDEGLSGNRFPGAPSYFQIVVPADHHLLLVLNETQPNSGIGLPGMVLVEAFSDTLYTDLAPVPEPATWALMAGGMGLLLATRKGRSDGIAKAS